MHFEKEYIYHIFNQRNNRRKIFFEKKNYFYFLEKIKIYILPYADIFAWCLMPNHLMVLVKDLDLPIDKKTSHTMTQSHRMTLTKIVLVA